MELNKLLKGVFVEEIIGEKDLEITDVIIDSKKGTEGCLFVAIKGTTFDGHDYIEDVKKYGVKAVVCEKKFNSGLTEIIVKDSRKALSLIASNFYSNPEKKLKIIGVIGTNGKTSTAHILRDIICGAGIKCGVIGTIGTFYGDKFIEPTLTTPDPMELFSIFNEMKNDGVKVVVMEVSAHSIELKKVCGIVFDVGIFTNFSQDHLDFFGDMERYKRVKLSFFGENCKFAIVNGDDPVGREIANSRKDVLVYGIDNPADVFAINVKEGVSVTKYVVNLFDMVYSVTTKLLGKFNVYNSLAAITAASIIGIKLDDVIDNLQKVNTVKGRMELIYSGSFKVFIDYAHTPDGLDNSLTSLKKVFKKKVICVFGCGGNRDKGKRPIMGEVSGEKADFTVITSDNPRYEDPMEIIFDVEKGIIGKTKNYVIVQDRVEAIKYALNYAKIGDVILIAGKGCENYQDVLGIKKIYNDKDTVINLIKEIES